MCRYFCERFSFNSAAIFLVGGLLFQGQVACNKTPERENHTPPAEEALPLMEAVEPSPIGQLRCHSLPELRLPWFRSKKNTTGTSSAVELGNSVEVAGGFATSQLTFDTNSRASLLYFDDKGTEKKVELGQVHGSVEAPQLLAVGSDLVVALGDNDASRRTVRLARIRNIASAPQVTWGPEVRVSRSETFSFSLAAAPDGAKGEERIAYLVWDEHERSSLRSRIHLLRFSVDTMKELALPSVISVSHEDAVRPLLLPYRGGFWALWLSYAPILPTGRLSSPSNQLIEEPPIELRVRKFNERGGPLGESILLSALEVHVRVYDGMLLGEEGSSIVVAHRATQSARPIGASPIVTSIVGSDGSISTGLVEHPILGPGAPFFLKSGVGEDAWLVARGVDQEVLLGYVDTEGHVSDFSVERGLEGKIPLLMRKTQALSMEAVGLDLKLSLSNCDPAP